MAETISRGKDRFQYSLLGFFGLTFLISWGVWVPLAVLGVETAWSKIGAFGPSLAALLLAAGQNGKPGLRDLLGKLFLWRVHWGWYAFSILGPPLIMLAAIQIYRWQGGGGLVWNDPSQWYLSLAVLLYVLFTSVIGEEIGWRGYALPGLLSRVQTLGASLLVGAVWALWHLPLFWLPGDFHQELPLLVFFLQVAASSVIYGWMFVNTRGSLLLPNLFHAVTNTAVGLLPVLPMSTDGDLRPFYISVILLTAIAALLPVLFGRRLVISPNNEENS